MKERGIIFHPWEIQPTLSGMKSQFRRPIKLVRGLGRVTNFQESTTPGYDFIMRDRSQLWHDLRREDLLQRCPFGQIGDRLWVKETWSGSTDIRYVYKPQQKDKIWYRADNNRPTWADGAWRSSVHMPRHASRFLGEITGIRAEIVQEISREGVMAERPPGMIGGRYQCWKCNGSGWSFSYSQGCPYCEPKGSGLNHTDHMRRAWNMYYGKRFPWDGQPWWVWVVEFKTLEISK